MNKTARLMEALDRVKELFWKEVVGRVKYKSPLDSMALFGHYPLSSMLFVAIFICLLKGYLQEDLIQCYSLGGGLVELEDPLRLQVCLLYSHIELDDEGHRGSVLNYGWHPYVFVVVAFLMYLPRLIRKTVEHEGLERFLSSLHGLHGDDATVKDKVRQYCYEYAGSHKGQLAACLKVSLACLVCDVVAIFILDMASLSTFYNGFTYYPYVRDMVNYDSLFSRVFPPTTKCSITPIMQIALLNTQTYGCSLPLNWYYEKIYIALLLYFVILALSSVISFAIDLCTIMWPGRRYSWVAMGGHYTNWTRKVAKCWTTDELFVLKHFKKMVGLKDFVNIIGDVVAIQDSITEVIDEC